MKKIAKAALAVVLVLAMTVSVFAAPSVSRSPARTASKSAVSTFGIQNATIVDATGNTIKLEAKDIVTCIVVKDADTATKDELKNAADDLTALVPDLADELPAGVVPADLTVKEVHDVSVTGTVKELIANGGSVKFHFTVPGVKKGDFVVALHKGENGWEALPASAVGLNNVAVTLESFSPVAIVALKGVAITGGVTSPSTGMEVANVAYGVVAACVAAL